MNPDGVTICATKLDQRLADLASVNPHFVPLCNRSRPVSLGTLWAAAAAIRDEILGFDTASQSVFLRAKTDLDFTAGALGIAQSGKAACLLPRGTDPSDAWWCHDLAMKYPDVLVDNGEVSTMGPAGAGLGLRHSTKAATTPFLQRESVVIPTSGTTGKRKGVTVTYESLFSCLPSASLCTFGTRWATTFPRESVSWFSNLAWSVLCGGTLCEIERRTPNGILRVVEKEGVEILTCGVALMELVVRSRHLHRYDLSSLQVVGLGGSLVSQGLVRHVQQEMGCAVVISYGTTELGGPITSTYAESAPPESGAIARDFEAANVGRPFANAEVKVVDANGEPLSVGQEGELLARRKSRCEPWCHTGDLAQVEPDGSIRLLGRIGDQVVRAGRKLDPTFLEGYLTSRIGCDSLVVVGVPDPVLGQELWLFIERAAQTGWSTASCARACLRQLRPPVTADRVIVCSPLPRNELGDPLRFKLRSWASSEKKNHPERRRADLNVGRLEGSGAEDEGISVSSVSAPLWA